MPTKFPTRRAGQTSSKAKPRSKRRWLARVKTVSTFPPQGLFTKDAATIARSLASKKVSPKGPGSGMRMLTYFINRGGRGLSASTPRRTRKGEETSFEVHSATKQHTRHKAS